MQDRFKCRVWNTLVKKFSYFDEPEMQIGTNGFDSGLIFPLSENSKLYIGRCSEPQFCTSLKDKNGKLIYEGDIVKIFHVSGTMQGKYFFDVVEWNDLRCRFDTENYGIIDDDDIYEVIGNIYENPELLEEYNGKRNK